MTLIYLSLALVAGVFSGSLMALPPLLALGGLLPLPLLALGRHRRTVITAGLCLTIVVTGNWLYRQTLADSVNTLQHYNDSGTVTLQGMVSQNADNRDQYAQLRLAATQVEVAGSWQPVSGLVLVTVERYPEYHYGDVLQLTGQLVTPPVFSDFDYKGYLASQEIYSTIDYPQLELVASGQGIRPLGWLYSLRERMANVLQQVLPEPQAALAQGMVLGLRAGIPADIQLQFQISGTTHILAISGANLSIFSGIMLAALAWLFGRRRGIHIWLALGLLWVYTIISGLQPPVVRAAVMASLFLLAELTGRQKSAFTALALAAAVMVALSPRQLWSVSLQMSFAAMAGLILVLPRLQETGRRLISRLLPDGNPLASAAFFISDSFAVSLAALIGVWPLIAYYYGNVSLVGPLATLLALPALAVIMVAGLVTGLLGLVSLALAQFAAWITWLPISYMLGVVRATASLPLAYFTLPTFSAALIWVYYGLTGLLLWLWSRHKASEPTSTGSGGRLGWRWAAPALALISLATLALGIRLPDDNLHVSILNVGQGDAILIQYKNQDILVDGGPNASAVIAGLGQKMPFWDRTIELVVMTHADTDHYTGLVEVLKRYHVQQFLCTDVSSDSPVFTELEELLKQKGVPQVMAVPGLLVKLADGATAEVLNPPLTPFVGTDADDNNNSLVLDLKLGQVSFLLTADIQSQTEQYLASQRLLPETTVLKVAHHGSAYSSGTDFLAITSPIEAVISVGPNDYGHPTRETLDRLNAASATIYRTDQDGTLEFITDGQRLWLRRG